MQNTESLLMKVGEAATLLEISRTTLYRLIVQQKVPYIRLNGTVRIPRRELEEWISQQSQSHLKSD